MWFLTWIDRWEPEPPAFVIGAFLWGAGVSAFISGIVNTIFLVATQSMTATAMFSAPFIEESTKAAFLIIVLLSTRRGRAEFNSLTDALVYGGMVGLGFAWIEHIGYALMADDMSLAWQIIAIRLVLTSYLHPVLTMIVAIGIWAGVSSKGAMRIGWPVVAWCAAVFLHFLHNGSVELMGTPGIFVAAAAELATFISLIVLGVRSRKKEQQQIVAQLPAMVYFGWITPSRRAGWPTGMRASTTSARPAREEDAERLHPEHHRVGAAARSTRRRQDRAPLARTAVTARGVGRVGLPPAADRPVDAGPRHLGPIAAQPGRSWGPNGKAARRTPQP